MHMVKIASNPKSETNVLKFNDIFIFFLLIFSNISNVIVLIAMCNVQCTVT